MKKILLVVAAVAVAGICQTKAQVAEGSWLISGGVGFSSTSGETSPTGGNSQDLPTVRSINFSPAIGYFLTNRMALGVQLTIGSGKEESTTVTGPVAGITTTTDKENKTNTFGIAPVLRNYYMLNDKWSLFSQGTIGYLSSRSENSEIVTQTQGTQSLSTTTESEVKTGAFNIGLGAGITYFMTPKLALEGTLGLISYTSDKSEFSENGKDTSEEKHSNFTIDAKNAYTLGSFGLRLTYFMGK